MNASYQTCPHCSQDFQSEQTLENAPNLCPHCQGEIPSEQALMEEKEPNSFTPSHLYPPGYSPDEKVPVVEAADPQLPPRSSARKSVLPSKFTSGTDKDLARELESSIDPKSDKKPTASKYQSIVWAALGVIILIITSVALLKFG